MTWLVNRYTVGGALLLLVAGLLWLQFGGAISAWSSGVYKALVFNREAEAKLLEAQRELASAQQEGQRVLQEYTQAQHAVRNLSRQIQDLKQRSDQAVARAREKDTIIASLQGSLRRLEAERRALAPVTSLEEAKRALEKFHPAYR